MASRAPAAARASDSLTTVPPAVRSLAIAIGIGGAALALLVVALVPVRETIALPVDTLPVDGRFLGVLLWTAVCLATSSLGLIEDGRAGVVFALGPLIAVAALGGPTAVAFVALFGTFELRELRGEIPWYGVLANHGMTVLAWTTAALVLEGLRAAVGGASSPLVGFVILMAAAGVGAGLSFILATVFVQLRTGRPFASVLPGPASALAIMLVAEAALAWLVAGAYVGIAWWSAFLFIVVDAGAAGSLARHRAGWHLRHHPLTELPNGLSLREHATDLRKTTTSGVCVFFIDLDWFKVINDDYGSDVGDHVLRVTGERLAATCRQHDFLAHLHGDEFVLLARGIADGTAAAAFERRLVEAVEPPIPHAVGELHVSATVGFRLVTDLAALDTAIRDADHVMQAGKRAKAAATGRTRRSQ